MGVAKTCDVCRMARQKLDLETMTPVTAVRRYTLRREVDQTQLKGVRSNRHQVGAGGIDLCDECWDKICKPNTNPNKSPRLRRALVANVDPTP